MHAPTHALRGEAIPEHVKVREDDQRAQLQRNGQERRAAGSFLYANAAPIESFVNRMRVEGIDLIEAVEGGAFENALGYAFPAVRNPMLVTLLEMNTEARLVQPRNASPGMLVTPSGTTTFAWQVGVQLGEEDGPGAGLVVVVPVDGDGEEDGEGLGAAAPPGQTWAWMAATVQEASPVCVTLVASRQGRKHLMLALVWPNA